MSGPQRSDAGQRRVRRARPPPPRPCVVPLSDVTLVSIRKWTAAFAGTQQYVAWWEVQTDAGKHTLSPERDVTRPCLLSVSVVCFPDKSCLNIWIYSMSAMKLICKITKQNNSKRAVNGAAAPASMGRVALAGKVLPLLFVVSGSPGGNMGEISEIMTASWAERVTKAVCASCVFSGFTRHVQYVCWNTGPLFHDLVS